MENTITIKHRSSFPSHSHPPQMPFTVDYFPQLLFLISLSLFGLYTQASAQTVQYTNQAIDLGMRGTQTVNPVSRGVEFEIPISKYRGRAGLDVPVTLSY